MVKGQEEPVLVNRRSVGKRANFKHLLLAGSDSRCKLLAHELINERIGGKDWCVSILFLSLRSCPGTFFLPSSTESLTRNNVSFYFTLPLTTATRVQLPDMFYHSVPVCAASHCFSISARTNLTANLGAVRRKMSH